MNSTYPDLTTPHPGTVRPKIDGHLRRSRTRALLFMGLAVLFSLAAAWLTTREISRHDAIARVPMSLVAVAASDIPRGTALRRASLDFIEWPAAAVPPGATTKANAAALEGRIVAHDLGKGEPLLEIHLASKEKGLGLSAVLPNNERAMTVMVNEVIGVAGFIQPEDYVDVIATMSTSPSGAADEIRAKLILQNVKVLAVGQEMVNQESKPVKVSVVTLLVDAEQSERLALASTQGKILLTLRSRSDTGQTVTTGITAPELYGIVEKPKEVQKRTVRAVTAEKAYQPPPDVVEVLRGDRLEERKVASPRSRQP